jgi:hypothetical protein
MGQGKGERGVMVSWTLHINEGFTAVTIECRRCKMAIGALHWLGAPAAPPRPRDGIEKRGPKYLNVCKHCNSTQWPSTVEDAAAKVIMRKWRTAMERENNGNP